MADPEDIRLAFNQGLCANSGVWYNSLQRLGRGGNAVTYLMVASGGSHRGFPFAVKVFRRISKPERRESFLKEVEFLRQCNHPGILRIFDEGTYRKNHPFVVAEYLPQTLGEVIRSRQATLIDKLSFSLQLISALEYLAGLQPTVVHRDIKPQNVFIKGRSCVLGDFGLMKRLPGGSDDSADDILKDSVGPGMPFFYRTPDLVAYARGTSPLTIKSDVYQLGLVLAEFFTGRNPQRRAEYDDHLSKVVLDSLGHVPGSYGEKISDFIQSMLADDPARRPELQTILVAWQGLFFDAAKRIHAIEGSVF